MEKYRVLIKTTLNQEINSWIETAAVGASAAKWCFVLHSRPWSLTQRM